MDKELQIDEYVSINGVHYKVYDIKEVSRNLRLELNTEVLLNAVDLEGSLIREFYFLRREDLTKNPIPIPGTDWKLVRLTKDKLENKLMEIISQDGITEEALKIEMMLEELEDNGKD